MDRDAAALTLVQILKEKGHIAYFAGGFVRDMLLGYPCDDIDIATSCPAEELPSYFSKTVPVGLQFGSTIVSIEDHPFEVTTFRTEGPYLDGRRPSTIEASSAEEDAKRRSFTINGMFYDPLNDEILDYVGGQDDLKAGVIRAIGEPDKRFEEDKLRMIRALRFATRFDFKIEPKTQAGIETYAEELYPAVAVERIWQEFKKIKTMPHLALFIRELYRYGLLEVIFPECHTEEIDERLESFARLPSSCPTIGALMLLFPEKTLEERLAICQELKVSNEEKKITQRLHTAEALIKKGTKTEWVRFYADPLSALSLEIVAASLGKKRNQFLSEHLRKRYANLGHIHRKRANTPLVTAHDLQEKGVQPGPEMGKLLARAEEIAIEENLQTKEAILTRLEQS